MCGEGYPDYAILIATKDLPNQNGVNELKMICSPYAPHETNPLMWLGQWSGTMLSGTFAKIITTVAPNSSISQNIKQQCKTVFQTIGSLNEPVVLNLNHF